MEDLISIRSDPSQGICWSVTKIGDSQSGNSFLQWRCNCWSIQDDFALEWDINLPYNLLQKIGIEPNLLANHISCIKGGNFVFAILVWSTSYIWVYCHDIAEFSRLSGQGLSVSIEPNIHKLDGYQIDEEVLNIGIIEVSLPIIASFNDFQCIAISDKLSIHTIRLVTKQQENIPYNLFISSNWWGLATYNEPFLNQDNKVRSIEKYSNVKKAYSTLKSMLRSFSWNNDCVDTMNKAIDPNRDTNFNILKFDHSLEANNIEKERRENLGKFTLSKRDNNILIIPFPSCYSKWNTSFLCFFIFEKMNTQEKENILVLFRHDTFGVIEFCWSITLPYSNKDYFLSLIAIPYTENTYCKNIITKSTMQSHLSLALHCSLPFGLFVVYKSFINNQFSLSVMQLITQKGNISIYDHLKTEKKSHPLLSWTLKPNFNFKSLVTILNLNTSDNLNIDIVYPGIEYKFNDSNIENNESNSDIADQIRFKRSEFKNFNCILIVGHKVHTLSLANNGHEVICNKLVEHPEDHKMYHVTYFRNILYILTTNQPLPLRIDLLNISNFSIEFFNLHRTSIDEYTGDNSDIEFNELLSYYKNLRNGGNITEMFSENQNLLDLCYQEIYRLNTMNDPPDQNILNKILMQLIKDISFKKIEGEFQINFLEKNRYTQLLIFVGKIINLHKDYLNMDLINLWSKCCIIIDSEYWENYIHNEDWISHISGTCLNQITSECPDLLSDIKQNFDLAEALK
ncbi:hypothetical protein ACR3K2_01460 [Cryptosporidium serpentis]